jgi:alpha-1,3-rhamnosyl/mannosyltransferase
VCRKSGHTAPQGADEEFFHLGACRRPEKFIPAVSTLHPHKNLTACCGVRRSAATPEYRLVVAGMHGFFSGQLHALREELGLGGAVDFPGWIPRADLFGLFARASAFVYPSFFEGFGIPVVEALAAGVPTACSAIEPIAGIASDAACCSIRTIPAIRTPCCG